MMSKRFCICRCYFTHNIFLKNFNCHIIYENRSQFLEEFSEVLKEKGCENPSSLIPEIEKEILRRRNFLKKSAARKLDILSNYKALHPQVYDLQKKFLDPTFLKLSSDARQGIDITERLQEVGENIYCFPVFTSEFCELFLAELKNFEASPFPKARPNTMNKYGIMLNELGMDKRLLSDLRNKYLDPVSRIVFPESCGTKLDSDKSFIVKYKMGKDVDLDYHFDNAEVTLNVALTPSEKYDGGELYFRGITRKDNDTKQWYEHQYGWGVLHMGGQMHGASPITKGERYNFIMWMRASSVRNSECPMCQQQPSLLPVDGDSTGDGFTEEETAFCNII